MVSKAKCAVSGAAAGLVNGFFGAGGGMILTPLLTRWCGLDTRTAFATSLSVTLPLSVISLIVLALGAPLPFPEAWPYLLGGGLGGIAGGLLFRKAPPALLHRLLGAVIVWGGVRMLLG